MSTGPSSFYDEFVSYDFLKIQFCLKRSEKIESSENLNLTKNKNSLGRWIRLKIGNNVIEKKYMVPFKKLELTLT